LWIWNGVGWVIAFCFGCRDPEPIKNLFDLTPLLKISSSHNCNNFFSKKSAFPLDLSNRRLGYLSKRLWCLSQLMNRSVYKCNGSNKCEFKILTNLPLSPIYSFRCGHVIWVPWSRPNDLLIEITNLFNVN